MTANMKAKEIRRRASTDLVEEIKRLGKSVFDQRFRGQSEEKSDRGLVRRSRRDIARIHTVLRERELAGAVAAAAPAGGAPAAVPAKQIPTRKGSARKAPAPGAAAAKKERPS